jgi:hypothetical protein
VVFKISQRHLSANHIRIQLHHTHISRRRSARLTISNR